MRWTVRWIGIGIVALAAVPAAAQKPEPQRIFHDAGHPSSVLLPVIPPQPASEPPP